MSDGPRAFRLRARRGPAGDIGAPESTLTPAVPGSAATIWQIPVTSVEGLFRQRQLSGHLAGTTVLIHQKRPSSEHLVALARSALPPTISVRSHVLSMIDMQAFMSQVTASRKPRTITRQSIDVVVVDTDASQLSDFLDLLRATRYMRRGLWVVAHPADVALRHFSQFDALFCFDMAQEHFDRLRSVFPLPAKRYDNLESYVASPLQCGGQVREAVLVFMSPLARTGARVATIADNPAVLHLYAEEGGMALLEAPPGVESS